MVRWPGKAFLRRYLSNSLKKVKEWATGVKGKSILAEGISSWEEHLREISRASEDARVVWQTEPRELSCTECQRGHGVEGNIVKGLVGFCQYSWLLLCVRMGNTWKVWAEEWFSGLELKESFCVLCWDPAVGGRVRKRITTGGIMK